MRFQLLLSALMAAGMAAAFPEKWNEPRPVLRPKPSPSSAIVSSSSSEDYCNQKGSLHCCDIDSSDNVDGTSSNMLIACCPIISAGQCDISGQQSLACCSNNGSQTQLYHIKRTSFFMSSSVKHSRKQSTVSTHSRTSTVTPKIEVTINVYDLLPPSRLSSLLWTIGSGLLHSGVVIGDREYAYGGHNRRGLTGVYWTRPQQEPPGGRFRCDVLQGFTFRTEKEIDEILQKVSDSFLGTSYNLLTRNCNHFTSALCEALTSRAAPSWLNRAASIGLALPCVVPKEWITPPDAETAEGELVEIEGGHGQIDGNDSDEDEYTDDESDDERAAMISREQRLQQQRHDELRRAGSNRHRKDEAASSIHDSSGRKLPAAERAPV